LNGARDGQFMMEFSLGESWWTADSFCLNMTERDRGLCWFGDLSGKT
jgi:hypothetical protein